MNSLTRSLFQALLSGDRFALSKCVTLIESLKASDREASCALLQALEQSLSSDASSQSQSIKVSPFPWKLRLGITGAPGVGKSTFLSYFAQILLQKYPEIKVAMSLIDPTSKGSGGSLLADITRFSSFHSTSSEMHMYDRLFIRPSPSSILAESGLAPSTPFLPLLFEAWGAHASVIESVGVGQCDTLLKESVCDLMLLLMNVDSGDQLQWMKKGILETADMILITKVETETKRKAAEAMKRSLSFSSNIPESNILLLNCSSAHPLLKEELQAVIDKIAHLATQKQASLVALRGEQKKHLLLWQLASEMKRKLTLDYQISPQWQAWKQKLDQPQALYFDLWKEICDYYHIKS